MSPWDWVELGAAVVVVIASAVSLYYAGKAKAYSDKVNK